MEPFSFPQINPVILHIWGPIALRWYNLAYILGIILGLTLLKWWGKKEGRISSTHAEQFLPWCILAIVIGGRVGEFLFYSTETQTFWDILYIWEGGMSFHGAFIGMVVTGYFFSKRNGLSFLGWMDHIALVAPIGIFLGRMANFINDELYGRVTNVWWAVLFPNGGYLPRHPSQLYEAFLEGILLFSILNYVAYFRRGLKQSGKISSIFLCSYGIFRFIGEFFREPDGWIGPITTGQGLSLLMVMGGILLFVFKRRKTH